MEKGFGVVHRLNFLLLPLLPQLLGSQRYLLGGVRSLLTEFVRIPTEIVFVNLFVCYHVYRFVTVESFHVGSVFIIIGSLDVCI